MKRDTRARVPLSTLSYRHTRIDPGSEAELKALARSWLAQPIHDILVRQSDGAIADGNRRVMGLELLGETEADVVLLDGDLSDADLDVMAMVSAYHRSPLGGYEQASILRSLKEGKPDVTNREHAARLDIDPSMIPKLLSVFGCLPEVQDAARAGKIGVTTWYEISQTDDQLAALADALNGASREKIRKKRRPRDHAAPRVARIKCPLPSGPVITVAGEALSLEEAIEALGEAIKAMREASKRGVTAKTFASQMKDMAAAG